MGGRGSGVTCYHWWRPAKKATVEDCRHLDAGRWSREGILKAGVCHSGSWCWFRDASRAEQTSSLGYEVNTLPSQGWVRLFYRITRTGEELDYRVRLTTTAPRLGGLRWWLVC